MFGSKEVVAPLKKLVFSVYDEQAKIFNDTVCHANKGVAIRSFSEAVTQNDSFLAKHASDFKLYCVGEYYPESGKFKSYEVPELVCHASDFVTVKKEVL